MEWQQFAVLGVLAAAVWHILRRIVRLFATRRKTACGGCSGCAAGDSRLIVKPLVGLGVPENSSLKEK